MKGDFTRFTYHSSDHFNRVYKQQGRAELDADFNEYVDLATDANRTETVDIVGQAGVPRGDAFKVEVINNNTDLLIHKGHAYVDGLLCVLENDIQYMSQPHDVLQAALAPVLNRKDLVYLHVMERHITWVENDVLLEPALQGADTSTRVQTIAQVRIQTGISAGSTCGNVSGWPPAASGARLTTGTKAVDGSANPCVLPESGGYSGIENRLYRVEIHTGGPLASATFKWSRDNGAVLVPVDFIGKSNQVQARTIGRDQVMGLKKGDWVELSSDTTDLTPSAGTLAQIVDITPDLTVQLTKNISSYNGQTHLKLRRWDQGSDEIALNNGATLELEDGITVAFSGSDFQPGDAWMFTARVGGKVEQLVNAPPSAIVHHYAPLAIINWQAGPAGAGSLVGAVEPCRKQFPPLTDITATDVKFNGSVCKFGASIKTVQQAIDALCDRDDGCCTVVKPGPRWMSVFDNIPAAGAHFCFRPGTYELSKRVEVTGKNAIILSGVGEAAKIVALNDECAFRFVNCASVTIRDVCAEGRVCQTGSGSSDGTLGVISIKNATDVLIENCRLTSADGPHRTTACLSIHTANRAGVRNNRFVAGVQQVGVLFANVNNVQLEGNLISGTARSIATLTGMFSDPQFLAAVRTRLLTNLFVGDPAPKTLKFNVTATVGGQQVRFLAPQSHIAQWGTLLQQNPMPGTPSTTNIEDYVQGLANRILRDNAFESFAAIRRTILANVSPSAQGITVGGTVAESVVIRSNRLTGFMEGIHVGLSAPSPNISIAERVTIHDNQVSVTLGMGATRGRHGIYVGNVSSSSIRGNRLSLVRPAGSQDMQIDGIRVFGRLGRSILIRENHLAGFNVGIHFELRGATPATPMWLINDNLAEGSNPVVSAPNVANKANNWG